MNTPYSRAPHVGSQGWSISDGSPHAALLIDFDNVTMGRGSNLSSELKTLLNSDIIKGKVAVQRAYADWRRYPQYIVPLSEASIDLIFAPAYGSSKKNATDIRMAIDALELVFIRPEIGTFILLTGDSDFSSVVLKLKEYGKYVIGVGIQESSSDILVQNCDEYYSYTSITGLTKTSEADRAQFDPWVLVKKAADKMVERGDVMRSDRLKQVMREIDPGFSEGEHGFSKFSKFLAEASSRGLVDLKKMENGQYEVGPSKGRRGGRSSRSSRAGTPATAAGESPLEHAFEILRVALGELTSDGRSPARDSDVKRRILVLEPAFDEAELGFPKFSRFLAQAEESSVVELRKKHPEGYTEVLLKAGTAAPSKGAGRSGSGASSSSSDSEEGGPARSGPGRREGRGQRESSDDAPVRLGRRTRPRGRRVEETVEQESAEVEVGSGRGSREDAEGGRSESRQTESRSRRGRRGRKSEDGDAGDSAEERQATDGRQTSEERESGGRGRGRGRRDRSKEEGADTPSGRRGDGRRGRRTREDAPADRAATTDENDEPSASTMDEVASPTEAVAHIVADDASQGEVEIAEVMEDAPSTAFEDAVDDAPVAEAAKDSAPDAAEEPAIEFGRGFADDMPVIKAVPESSADDSAARGRTLHPRQQRRRRGGGDGPPPIFEGQGVTSTGGSGSAGRSGGTEAAGGNGSTTDVESATVEIPADIFKPGHGVIDPEALGLPTEPAAITRYLTHRYKGVGARTAEAMVERFGDEVFEILHREPRRITEVLPEHRAAQLIQAWRGDLARRSEGEVGS